MPPFSPCPVATFLATFPVARLVFQELQQLVAAKEAELDERQRAFDERMAAKEAELDQRQREFDERLAKEQALSAPPSRGPTPPAPAPSSQDAEPPEPP